MKPDPARAALAQATGLLEILRDTPELAPLADLTRTIIENLRQRCGLLPGAEVRGEDFEAGFELAWPHFLVRVGKGGARKAALRASKKPSWPGWTGIVDAIEAQKQSARWRAGTVPNPETWFNGERWLDDPATMYAPNGNGHAQSKHLTDLQRENAAQEAMRRLR